MDYLTEKARAEEKRTIMTVTRARAYSRQIGNTTFYVYVTPFLEDGKQLIVIASGRQTFEIYFDRRHYMQRQEKRGEETCKMTF